MRRTGWLFLAGLGALIVAAGWLWLPAGRAAQASSWLHNAHSNGIPFAAPDRLLIGLKDDPLEAITPRSIGAPSLDQLMARFDVQSAVPLFHLDRGDIVLKQQLGMGRMFVLTLPAGSDLPAAQAAFAADPAVAFAEPDFVGYGGLIPSDDSFNQQWALNNTGQAGGTPGADIDAPGAWDVTTGISAVVLAVIDTGVDLDHPDLAGKLVPGYDFVNNDGDAQDDYGHGTHVAGIIAAASDNPIGVAGVCWACRIMPLKALNNGNWGYYSWWISAIEYAVDNGAYAINMSMGGTSESSALHNAVRYAYYAGRPIAAAMMNDGTSVLYYPAAYDEVIAVGSTDAWDFRSSFSNVGGHVDLVAPGSDILSTMWDDTYAAWFGTSMATPQVVGVMGLLYSLHPSYSVAEIRTILLTTAEDQVGPSYEDMPGFDIYFGNGRLNAARAVSLAAGRFLETVTLTGPERGITQTVYTFTAGIAPLTASQPVTYTWQADHQLPVTHTGGLTDAVSFVWDVAGPQTVTLSAANIFGAVNGRPQVIVIRPANLKMIYLPVVEHGS